MVYKPELSVEKKKEVQVVYLVKNTDEYLPCVCKKNKKALDYVEHNKNRAIINNFTFLNYIDPNVKYLKICSNCI